MGTIADSGFPNLANWAKRHNPDGSIAEVVNLLSKKLNLLDDIPWSEGNLPTGHRITTTSNSLPGGTWRKINTGVPASKVETDQYDETCGRLEDESKVDEALAELNGDGPAYRSSEDTLKTEGLSQKFATSTFYESASTNPERVHGLTPRYGATSGYTASGYVGKGTNAGTNCQSIWLITWAPRKAYGIFPKGTQAGLQREDMGKQRVLDASGNAFWAWITKFVWRVGVAIEDYRYCYRFQWDPDDANMAADKKGLYLAMEDMLEDVFELAPSTRFYMSRTTKKRLNAQLASNAYNVLDHIKDSDGVRIQTFGGVPIRITDALVDETAIA